MKKLTVILSVVILASLALAPLALASEGAPAGNCPPPFELHHFHDHSGEHMHRHIGVDRDLNGDGYICMKMLPNDLHLHVDNALPLD
ncbi:MAG: hypothetical protein L0Z70_13165 [Chloroflexi bacterium]|nr:hypothetical protein [Chloroflexota bacterium]